MKFYISVAALVLCLQLSAKSTSTIKSTLCGIVTDAATKKPLVAATIFIHDVKVGVISKADGTYCTTAFQNGKYLVEVSYQGYASTTETIEINGNTIKNFALKEVAAEQEAVTITGTTSATKIKNATQAVSVITKQDLFKNNATNLIDGLSKSVTGFSSVTTGTSIAKPVIRGLGYNRVLTISDGVKQEGQQWGDEHGIEVDEASVQKVEVLKGAASLMYGSDALAGVINIISAQPVQQGYVKANVFSSYNFNNKMHSLHTSIAANHKSGFSWNVYTSNKNAADYINKYDDIVLNSRFAEHNFGGYIGVNKHWGFTHLLLSSFNQRLGVVDGSRDATTGMFTMYAGTSNEHIATQDELNSRNFITPYQQINHFKITIDNNIHLHSARFSINAAYQQNKRQEFGDFATPENPNLFLDLKTVTYNMQYHFAQQKGYTTTIGVNGMQQTNTNKASEVLIPQYRQSDAGVFIISKKNINKFLINAGLRFDLRNLHSEKLEEAGDTKFEEIKTSFQNLSGSLGFSYEANNNIVLKFNIARGFRAPTVSELSSNGAHEGTNRYEYGNKNLTSETSNQIDIGAVFNNEHINITANLFYNHISNYIFYNKLQALSGLDSVVNNNGYFIAAYQFNKAEANLYGFELTVDVHPHPWDWLHIQNSLSYVRGVFVSNYFGSNNLPLITPPHWLSEIKVDFKKCNKQVKNLFAKVETDNWLAQKNIFSSFNTETETPAYTLVNAGIGADFKLSKETYCNIYLSANNIFDIAYQHHLSRLKYTDVNNLTNRQGVFNMGRNIVFKINVPLSFKLKG